MKLRIFAALTGALLLCSAGGCSFMELDLADEAAASKDVDVRILGKKARMYLAMLKGETMDLDAVRLETIAKILELRGALGK